MTMLEFFSSDFVKLTVPLIAAVVAWFVNEGQKRKQEQYARKEEKYKALLSTLQGFYEGSQDTEKKRAFVEQVNQCWLYCPDLVIQNAYTFLEKVQKGDPERDETCGDLVAAIRRDMLSRKLVRSTSLDGQQFRHFQAR
jgi:Pyruvate/2-oxoacid:ferredoxin oxidoreductase delta subunit